MQGTGATAAWQDGHEWRALRTKRHTYAVYRVDGEEPLFDNVEDPYQMSNLVEDPAYTTVLAQLREMLVDRMHMLNDDFRSCTWYRDHWTRNRVILRSATLDATVEYNDKTAGPCSALDR